MKTLAIAVVAGLLALGGCNRGADNKEAVRQAVLDYLAKRSNLNVNSMQVDVAAVAFRQNEAEATVSFRPKGSAAAPAMTMTYTLEKKANTWVVKGRADAGGSPHAMPGAVPGQMPPGQMPPGHPSVAAPPAETKK